MSEVFLKDEDVEVIMKFQIGEIKQRKKVKIETEIWKQACYSLNYCKQGLISATSFTQHDSFSSSIYVFKVNKENTRKLCKTCLKLKIKTTEQRQ